MITTNKYILNEDIFEPSNYRNHKFSKICQLVKGPEIEDYLSKILHLNTKGQIDRIEKIGQTWQSYAPGQKPQLPKIDVIDYIEYDSMNRIKSIISRLINNSQLEIGRIKYLYDKDQLIQIKKTEIKNNQSYTTNTNFGYTNSNIDKVEITEEIGKDLKLQNTINYVWNENNQIVKKKSNSISQPNTNFEFTNLTSSIFNYNKRNQLQDAVTEHIIGNDTHQSTTRFKYINSISNQLSQIEMFINGILSTSVKFAIDEKENIITQRIRTSNKNESLIEYKGYT